MEHNGGNYHDEYKKFIVTQSGAAVLDTALMERFGSNLDMEYMLRLAESRGIIYKKKAELFNDFFSFPEVKKVNKEILNKRNIDGSLFDDDLPTRAFDTSKPDHKILLFVETLGLEPLAYGKTGNPSMDKEFFKKYKSHPIVASFQSILS